MPAARATAKEEKGMTMKVLALVTALLGACTFDHGALSDLPDSGSGTDIPDAMVDAAMPLDVDADVTAPDAAGTAVTLSQNTSNTVSSGASIYCNNTQTMRDNAWYRAFKPSDYGVTGTLHISRVWFAVEGSKGASVIVSLYSYSGTLGTTLSTSSMTLLTSKSGSIPDNATPIAALVAVDVPASSTVVFEVSGKDTLNGSGLVTSYLHIGANTAGQSGSSYWRSAACGVGNPTSQSSHNVIMWMEGSY